MLFCPIGYFSIPAIRDMDSREIALFLAQIKIVLRLTIFRSWGFIQGGFR